MNYNPTNILTGVFILFLVSYLLVALFNFIYLKLSRSENKVKPSRVILTSAIVVLGWMASTVLAIWFTAQTNALIFSVFSLVIFFAFNYFLVEKLIGITGKHKIYYSLLLAIFLNPGWLMLIGIL